MLIFQSERLNKEKTGSEMVKNYKIYDILRTLFFKKLLFFS